MLTAFFVVSGEVSRNVEKYCLKDSEWTRVKIALHIPHLLYMIMNPVLYAVIMTDLRKCYGKMLCCRGEEE